MDRVTGWTCPGPKSTLLGFTGKLARRARERGGPHPLTQALSGLPTSQRTDLGTAGEENSVGIRTVYSTPPRQQTITSSSGVRRRRPSRRPSQRSTKDVEFRSTNIGCASRRVGRLVVERVGTGREGGFARPPTSPPTTSPTTLPGEVLPDPSVSLPPINIKVVGEIRARGPDDGPAKTNFEGRD